MILVIFIQSCFYTIGIVFLFQVYSVMYCTVGKHVPVHGNVYINFFKSLDCTQYSPTVPYIHLYSTVLMFSFIYFCIFNLYMHVHARFHENYGNCMCNQKFKLKVDHC